MPSSSRPLWDATQIRDTARMLIEDAYASNNLANLRELCEVILESLRPPIETDDTMHGLQRQLDTARSQADEDSLHAGPATGRGSWGQDQAPAEPELTPEQESQRRQQLETRAHIESEERKRLAGDARDRLKREQQP